MCFVLKIIKQRRDFYRIIAIKYNTKMGKKFLIVFAILSIISLSQSSFIDFKYKEFLQAFLSKAKHQSVELNSRCLSDKIMETLRRAKNAFETGRMTAFGIAVEVIIENLSEKCPKDDILKLYHSIKEQLKHFSLVTEENMPTDLIEISKILIAALKEEQHSAKSIGEMLGSIVYYFLKIKWKKKNNLRRAEEKSVYCETFFEDMEKLMIKEIDVNPLLDEYIDKCIGHSETSTIEVHVDYNTTIEDKINQVLKKHENDTWDDFDI